MLYNTVHVIQYSTCHIIQYMSYNTVHAIQYSTCHTIQYMSYNTVHVIQYSTCYTIQYMSYNTVHVIQQLFQHQFKSFICTESHCGQYCYIMCITVTCTASVSTSSLLREVRDGGDPCFVRLSG